MKGPQDDPTPPKWKLIIVTWLGLFPVLLVLSYGTKLLGVKPLILKLFIETIILVPLLNYVIQPFMDSLLSKWLYRGIDEKQQQKPITFTD